MKPVEKTDEDVSGALVNTRNKNGSVALAVNQINSFEQAEALADWIAQSPVFNKGFKEQVQKEDGTSELVVNKSAIVTCLLLGNELGFTPMVSVTFGKTLDREAAIKVERGRSMGLNPMAAMQNIYVFSTSQAEIFMLLIKSLQMPVLNVRFLKMELNLFTYIDIVKRNLQMNLLIITKKQKMILL